MFRQKFLWSVAVLGVAIALFCTAKPAHADLLITVQEGSGTTQSFSAAGSPTTSGGIGLITGFSVTTADYTINFLSGTEEQTGTSEVTSASVKVTLNTSTTNVLHITVTGTGFTAPITPPPISVDSQVGGTLPVGSESSPVTYQSFVAGTGMGVQTPTVSSRVYDSDATNLITSLTGTPYSIAEDTNIALTTAGDNLTFSASTTLTPVPTPDGFLLLASGSPLMGLGYWLRRRQVRPVAAA